MVHEIISARFQQCTLFITNVRENSDKLSLLLQSNFHKVSSHCSTNFSTFNDHYSILL